MAEVKIIDLKANVLEDNDIGKNFYEKNHYCPDGKEKIFKRWNKREIRYVKV